MQSKHRSHEQDMGCLSKPPTCPDTNIKMWHNGTVKHPFLHHPFSSLALRVLLLFNNYHLLLSLSHSPFHFTVMTAHFYIYEPLF